MGFDLAVDNQGLSIQQLLKHYFTKIDPNTYICDNKSLMMFRSQMNFGFRLMHFTWWMSTFYQWCLLLQYEWKQFFSFTSYLSKSFGKKCEKHGRSNPYLTFESFSQPLQDSKQLILCMNKISKNNFSGEFYPWKEFCQEEHVRKLLLK